jgi:hypothetical protein
MGGLCFSSTSSTGPPPEQANSSSCVTGARSSSEPGYVSLAFRATPRGRTSPGRRLST